MTLETNSNNDPRQRAYQEIASRIIRVLLREVTHGGYKLPERKIKTGLLIVDQTKQSAEQLEALLHSAGNDLTILLARNAQDYRLSLVAASAMRDKHGFLLIKFETPLEQRIKIARAKHVVPYGGVIVQNPDFVNETIGLNPRDK